MKSTMTSALALSALLILSACGTADPATNSKPTTQKSSLSEVGKRLDDAYAESIKRAESTDNPQEAAAIYEELLAIKPNDNAIRVRYARALRNDEQLQKAKTILTPITTGDNADPQALTELAMVHLSLGEFKDAELRARETITKEPKNGRAFLALGTALDAQKYYEQAETAFRRGIDYWDGDPAPILNNLALNLAAQSKLDEAILVLERAREISPHRREVERNYRIISTLKETAQPNAPKPNFKPVANSGKKTIQNPTAASRPQPVLENDPALKDFEGENFDIKIEDKPKEEVKSQIEEKEESANKPPIILQGPRTIQNWKR